MELGGEREEESLEISERKGKAVKFIKTVLVEEEQSILRSNEFAFNDQYLMVNTMENGGFLLWGRDL